MPLLDDGAGSTALHPLTPDLFRNPGSPDNMRMFSPISLFAVLPLAVLPHLAAAEVFKCTTADGKTSYSATPCTTVGAKEVVVPIVTGPMASPPQNRDWAAENAAINARVQAAEASRVEAAEQKASASAKTAEQITADCEANRGVDCSSEKEIGRRQADERTLTPDEAAALHRAAAGRRENDRQAAEAKKNADAAAKAAAAAAAAAAAKPGKT